jgi:hypothetical protein
MVIPRKWWSAPRSFVANSCWRQEPRGGGGEHNIIDVEEEVRSVWAAIEEEHGRVRLGFDKAL